MSLEEVVSGSIGPLDGYCEGYGISGAGGRGYVAVLTLSTGKLPGTLDPVVAQVAAGDRAAAGSACMGQTNTIAETAFIGPNGAIWGYDLARADGLVDGSIEPLRRTKRHDGKRIPIYPVLPLLDAGERLFGTERKCRFPLLPGSHVIGATRQATAAGPTSVWCAIALAIAADREAHADLLITGAGHDIPAENALERAVYLDRRMEAIAESLLLCGEEQGVKYREIFMGYRTDWVAPGYVGCARACAPCIVLARKAVPADEPASALLRMSLSAWERATRLATKGGP